MATIDVKDADGDVVVIEKPNANGRAAAAASRPVALSNEDLAALDGIETLLTNVNTALTTLNGHVDTLETLSAAANALLTTQNGYLDGVETLLAAPTPAGTNAIGTVTAVGNVASGAADSGNPVKFGGVYNAVPTTLAEGQRGNAQIARNGSLAWVDSGSAQDGSSNSTTGFFFDLSGTGRYLGVRQQVFNGTTWDRQRGDAISAHTRSPPRTKSASAVVAGSTTSQQLFAANSLRSKLIIQNQDAAINVFVNLGAVAVAGAGNLRIAPGATLELDGTSGTVNLIAASGTPAICAWEL